MAVDDILRRSNAAQHCIRLRRALRRVLVDERRDGRQRQRCRIELRLRLHARCHIDVAICNRLIILRQILFLRHSCSVHMRNRLENPRGKSQKQARTKRHRDQILQPLAISLDLSIDMHRRHPPVPRRPRKLPHSASHFVKSVLLAIIEFYTIFVNKRYAFYFK